MNGLMLLHRLRGQPVIVLGMGEAAEARRRLLERAGAQVVDDRDEGIDKGARLAFIAYEDAGAAEAEAIRLRCAGLLVNVTDRPQLCDFTVPSIVDRDPVIVAVATGGASAGLAKMLRLRLERMLPQSLGALAEALHAARGAVRVRWPDAAGRRRALDAALAEGGLLDPMAAHQPGTVTRWLAQGEEGAPASTYEIVLRSLDPDDLTLREARLLGTADTIAHEDAVPFPILARARADAARMRIADGAGLDREGVTVVLRAPRG